VVDRARPTAVALDDATAALGLADGPACTAAEGCPSGCGKSTLLNVAAVV